MALAVDHEQIYGTGAEDLRDWLDWLPLGKGVMLEANRSQHKMLIKWDEEAFYR